MFKKLLSTVLIVAISIGASTLVGVSIYEAIRSDGKISYCYITGNSERIPGYVLKGFRPWTFDRPITSTSTFFEATVAANTYGCQLK